MQTFAFAHGKRLAIKGFKRLKR